jgi:hypothetical protein
MKLLLITIGSLLLGTIVKANELYLHADFGVNKSITQWSWASYFRPMHNWSFGLEYQLGNERKSYFLGVEYNALFSRVAIGEKTDDYYYQLRSGNGYGHLSLYFGKTIYYKRKKKSINELCILASADYWNVFEVSQGSTFASFHHRVNWSIHNSEFGESAIGAGLHFRYAKTFWSKKGGKYKAFCQASVNFVSLPELGIAWQLNDQPIQSQISKHTPLQLNIGIAKRIIKSKVEL